ncbi:hypothetical protein [Brucella intermedia]|uniref:hypothetical protein n=1 Tax=Brucella intermedia TaxID=94625 RepID=UPI000EFDB018|nr:hypothetical protein [Brucella intermedia]KAB2720376.1 hypothetical protein F9K75_04710 [Brucella intermedia]
MKYEYDLPVIVTHEGKKWPSRLTVTRTAKRWEGKCYTHPELYCDMEQVATPRNGGFGPDKDHRGFLDQVCLVFDFAGGCDFEFATDDREPVREVLQ